MKGPTVRSCLMVILGLLLFSACGQLPTAAPAISPVPSPAVPPLHTRPEQAASTPCPSPWAEGETTTVRGLYRTSGDQSYLDVMRGGDAAPCWARLFLQGNLGLGTVSWDDPFYLEVTGPVTVQGSSAGGLWDMQVQQSSRLPFDPGAVRAACQQSVVERAAELQALDWSSLAIPSLVTGTVGFHPGLEAFAQAQVLLLGTDDRQPLLWATVRGPDLPEVRPLVHRWVEVECVYNLEQGRIVELTATIRGERLE